MRKKTMTELRRGLTLARREDAKARAQGRLCDEAMHRLESALWNAKQESSDEAAETYLNSVRDRLHALRVSDPASSISESLNNLAAVLGVGR